MRTKSPEHTLLYQISSIILWITGRRKEGLVITPFLTGLTAFGLLVLGNIQSKEILIGAVSCLFGLLFFCAIWMANMFVKMEKLKDRIHELQPVKLANIESIAPGA